MTTIKQVILGMLLAAGCVSEPQATWHPVEAPLNIGLEGYIKLPEVAAVSTECVSLEGLIFVIRRDDIVYTYRIRDSVAWLVDVEAVYLDGHRLVEKIPVKGDTVAAVRSELIEATK